MGLFEALESRYDDNLVTFGVSLEAHYDQINDLDDNLTAVYRETSERLGLSRTLDDSIALDMSRDLHMISSVVGDDECTTSDSYSLGPALIGFGPFINGIKVSWKDAGISKYIGNYAEGWILTPPSADATFAASNRRHAREAVPFVLDPVKLKLLSPVRKQSSTWDLDLESKLKQLAEIASWTDREWFTYDYHQMGLILANAVFDFEDARTFPYLFGTEGGCGGAPPYGNLDTVYSALFHYTRGRSKRAILGIMEEAVAVNTGSISPKDTFFLRNSHLANMGDKSWAAFETAYRSLVQNEGISRTQASDLLKEQDASVLPDYIKCLGVDIEPHSFVVGSSISYLRKEGLIMSELDVKVALDARAREAGLLGHEPIGDLMKRLEEDAAVFRSKHLKILSQISEIDPEIRRGLIARSMLMPSAPDEDYRNLTRSYYSMRTEQHARFSSLSYTDTIRLFKADDIREWLDAPGLAVRSDFAASSSFNQKWTRKFLEENTEERQTRRKIRDWFDSAPLSELLYNPLPPGVGTDDDRIARHILEKAKLVQASERCDMLVTLLFSGDKQLARVTEAHVRHQLPDNCGFRMLTFDTHAYTEMCVDGWLDYHSNTSANNSRLDEIWPNKIEPDEMDIGFFNFILQRTWKFPRTVVKQIKDLFDFGSKIHDRALIHVVYDYPNMERGLDLLKLDQTTGVMSRYSGGFLERRNLIRPANCWPELPMPKIWQWEDFNLHVEKKYQPDRGRYKPKIYGFNAAKPESYAAVRNWQKGSSSKLLPRGSTS